MFYTRANIQVPLNHVLNRKLIFTTSMSFFYLRLQRQVLQTFFEMFSVLLRLNVVYQLAKIDRRCYNEFLEWLFEYEHKKLGVPEPDLVFYLQVPIEISQSLLDSRYDGDSTKRDLHESDKDYLFQCEIAAQYASKRYKWKIINCSQDGLKIDEISDISKKIWKHFIKEVVHK